MSSLMAAAATGFSSGDVRVPRTDKKRTVGASAEDNCVNLAAGCHTDWRSGERSSYVHGLGRQRKCIFPPQRTFFRPFLPSWLLVFLREKCLYILFGLEAGEGGGVTNEESHDRLRRPGRPAGPTACSYIRSRALTGGKPYGLLKSTKEQLSKPQ